MPGKIPVEHPQRTQYVVMYGYDDAQILDIAGPLEVFSRCSRWLVDHQFTSVPPYKIELVADRAGPVRCSSGLLLHAQRAFAEVDHADIVLVSGGIGYRQALENPALLAWLRQQAKQVTRLGSICSGALILAGAGLLENRSATTHWAYCDKLAALSHTLRVDKEAIYIRDGNVYTSAGVLSGMDLALGIIEEEWGMQVAVAVAQELVMFTVRRGNDSQMSPYLEALRMETDRIQKLILWMLDHPAEDLSVDRLAQRVSMSPRNFTRRFADEVGLAPGKFVADLRFKAALRKLENTDMPLDKIASECGYADINALRRIFTKKKKMPLTEYRKQYGLRRSAAGRPANENP